MLSFLLGRAEERPLRVLCLGAHSDDIEIGSGGTVATLCASPRPVTLRWIVFSGTGTREREARDSAKRLARNASELSVDVLDYEDGFFPSAWGEIKRYFRRLEQEPSPDLVLTHHGRDRHQDHRVISELTWNSFRDHLILEYEIPKWEGDLGQPNLYVPLAREAAEEKVRHLVESFPSQQEKPWFDGDTFLGLSRLRGLECGAPEGHAEAFYMRKAVLSAKNL